ncbi:MAG: signal recognition particle-docking protein FtsY [Desulfovibrionaceae bacterium]|nr:signal recognition particle-docking protein FtsY [Desulfovibrionaceae bacterium]
MGIFSSFRGLLRFKAEEAAPVSGAALAENSDLTAEAGLLASLRASPPRLSAWLDLLLSGVEERGPFLESRLLLLFRALGTPEGEAARFVGDFSAWLGKMGYSRLEEFRSELQYRLALALDLEDEEDEQNRLLLKLGQGLAVTRARLGQGLNALFQPGRVLDESFWEELEEALLLGDVGMEAAGELSKRLRARALREDVGDPAGLRVLLREEIAAVFRRDRRIQALDKPEVILLVGVNGAGKTTTIAKLAHRYVLQGKKTLVAAADTFRAAAVDQLELWAKRAGADFYARPGGGDPAAVAYEATDKALREGYDALLVDTAGRLQTKSNLMDELSKIRRVMGKVMAGAPQRIILVLDANIGQNALSQVKLFGGGGVNELILTKLDGTAKGGAVVSVALSHEIPITYIGLGEKMEDLRPFDGEVFAAALLGEGGF